MNSSRPALLASGPAHPRVPALGSQLSGLFSALRSSIALLAVVFGMFGNGTAWGQSTIASDGFENSLSLFTATTGNGTFSTGSSTTGDRPASSPYAAQGSYGYGKTNGSVTITSSNIDTSSFTGVQMAIRLASFSIASTGNGADASDIVTVEVSPNGGSNYFSTVRVLGNSNSNWAYSSSGNASTAYDGDATPVSFNATTGYGTITITGIPSANNVRIRITLLNDNAAERWVIDDFKVTGTASPTITGTATATAFTTTYGTASSPQTFSIGGTNLTANLVATAPSEFEVSSDGTNYGGNATFTQTSGTASGSLRIKLKADAAVSGSPYNSKLIALTSTGATTVNITTAASGNTVTAKALTITGLTGTEKVYTGTTAATFTGTAAYSGLANSESFSVTGTPVASFSTAAVGSSKSITITGYTAPSTNYSLTQPSPTANITAAPLTITANNITKPQGATLSSPVSGSTAFSSSGLVNSETIGSVTITYGTGAASDAAADLYSGSVVASAPTGGTFTASNYSISYVNGNITVSANPAISTTGTLSAVSTTYGTASASPSSFSVSGGFLTGDLTVTAPSPFVISTISGGTYTSSLVLTQSAGSVASTTIYVRLPATATVSGSPYSGNVSISGGGATTQNVATASSTVAAKALTLSGLAGVSRAYDRTTTATLSGTPAYVGLANGESFSVLGTAAASFTTQTVGTAKPIPVTGYEAPASNYSITQPTGLSADITSVALTVTGASVTSKTYDGTAAASITGASLVGVIALDTVTVSGGGTFADVNAANGIAVTTALTLGGADAANYTLTQPTGLTGNITQATQTITFAALAAKLTTDVPFALTGTASSSLTVAYASSNTSVATVSGSTVTIVGAGTTTITASQAGNGNYSAATSVPQTLTVTRPPLAVWNPTWSGTAASPLNANTKDTNLTSAQVSRVGLTDAGNPSRHSSTAWNTTANYLTAVLTPASGYTINLNGAILAGAWGSSNTGPGSYEVRSSVDSYASSLGNFTSTSGGNTTNTITLPASGYNGLSSITLRFIGSSVSLASGVTASGGTGGFSTLTVNGSLVVPPAITGVATASAFTTTYGTASVPQTFSVGGSNLTASITATAPTGFEVASDGATYGATATFTQSGGTASGTLSVRLAATAVPGGTYNARTIALTSTDATTVNITTAASGNTVSTKALTLTGLTGVNKVYTGTTAATATGTAALSGVNGSDTVTPGGSPVYDFASASVGTAKSITTTGYTLGGAQASYYSLTQPSLAANITVAPLTVTANNVTKPQGTTLSSPTSGSTAFSSSGLVNSETIGSVTITYGTGAASDAAADLYSGSVAASAATGGTFTASNYSISYVNGNITVSANPAISTIGTLSAVSTTYGTASASPSSFSVSGGFLTGDLTVTAPSPFVISTSSGGTYTSSLVLTASAGTVASTTIYVRLPATATVSGSPYTGNVSISGGGATTQNVATASSTVTAKALTISGLTAADKIYDGNTTVSVTGTPAYVGLVNGETFPDVTGTVTWAFADAVAGTNKTLTRTGSYTAPSANYTVTQPSLSAIITALAPGAPTITAITPGNAQLSVAFTAPTSNGGSAVTNYKYSTNGGISFTAVSPASTSSPILITGLTNGTSYSVQILAVNSVGDGTPSTSTAAIPRTVPGAPTITGITASASGQASVAFTAPASNGGSAVTNYKYSTNGGTSFTAVSPASTSSPIVITGLVNGTAYNIQIRAVNEAGDGTATASTAFTASKPYYLMSSGDYSADFADIANWGNDFTSGTGADYWASVATNATGAIPDGVKTTVSSGTFNTTSTSGGVQKGGLASSNNLAGTLVMLSTGGTTNNNSVALDLLLNFTGRTAGTLSFDHACVFNSTGDRGATLEVYTSTDGSTWTKLSAASVPVVNNVAASGSKSLLTLPDGFSGNATARIRFYEYANGVGTTGSRPKISLDNVSVTSFTTPTLTTGSATAIAQTSATLGGNITATGGTNATVRGVYVSTTSGFADGVGTKISASGSFGTGAYTVNATSLTASTVYYFKAFATNSIGTSYGTQGTFTTLDKATPSITLAPTATAITYGQTLVSSTLSGGTASAAGTFAFTTPSTASSAGTASQDVTFTPSDSASYNTATTTVSVTVNAVTLTLTGLSANNKTYDGSATATLSGTPAYVGLVNSETFSVSGTASATFADSSAGSAKPVTVTGYTAPSANYTVTQPTGLTANIAKATPTITLAPTASSIAYGQTLASSILSGGTASVVGTFAFTTPSTAPNVGTASQNITFTPTDSASYNTATTSVSVTANPATLAAETITITSNNDGTYSASTASGSYAGGYTIRYSGRSSTVYGSSATAPSAPGFYTVTASPSDANYTGSNTQDYFIAGPIAENDTVTKPFANTPFKIPVATLLANDSRINTSGATVTTGLSITAVSGTASVSGAFVFSTPSSSGTESFTYTLSDGTTTATGTVTVVPAAAEVPFTLNIIRIVSGPAFDGTNTRVTVEFAGVPNQTYDVQYSTNLTTWNAPITAPTGTTGTFNVTFSASGNQTTAWNTSLFFRAIR
jgi:hypothetical protein